MLIQYPNKIIATSEHYQCVWTAMKQANCLLPYKFIHKRYKLYLRIKTAREVIDRPPSYRVTPGAFTPDGIVTASWRSRQTMCAVNPALRTVILLEGPLCVLSGAAIKPEDARLLVQEGREKIRSRLSLEQNRVNRAILCTIGCVMLFIIWCKFHT